MNTVASPMLVTAQQLQQLQQQNQHIQIQHYQPVPIQAVAGTPMVRPMVLKQHSLPAFSAQSLPQATAQGHVMAASTFHNVSVTPVVAASRVSLSIDNPRQLVRPPGSVIMAPAAALASPRRVQVPMAGIAGPIFIGRDTQTHKRLGQYSAKKRGSLCSSPVIFFTHQRSCVCQLNSRWTSKYHKGPTEDKGST